MSRPRYSIRFPMKREKTGARRGPRFRMVPDDRNLYGARGCVAGMVKTAIHKRDWAKQETDPELARLNRAQMRSHALWARIFAGHMDADSPLVQEAIEDTRRRSDAIIARNNRPRA
jgi:hypothetical protein